MPLLNQWPWSWVSHDGYPQSTVGQIDGYFFSAIQPAARCQAGAWVYIVGKDFRILPQPQGSHSAWGEGHGDKR